MRSRYAKETFAIISETGVSHSPCYDIRTHIHTHALCNKDVNLDREANDEAYGLGDARCCPVPINCIY